MATCTSNGVVLILLGLVVSVPLVPAEHHYKEGDEVNLLYIIHQCSHNRHVECRYCSTQIAGTKLQVVV